MEYKLPTYINNEKIEINPIPLRFFDKSTCDMTIKVNVPSETKAGELKLYWLVTAGGGTGGGGASYGFGAVLENPCDEIITIRAWGNKGNYELKPLIIEAGYKTENKKDYTTYAYTRYMKTSASDNQYTSVITELLKPNYIEIYCGKRLIRTIGTKNNSNTTFDEVGTQIWYNGVWQATSIEAKSPITFEVYSDSVYILPFISHKPNTKKLSDIQKYYPCIYVDGVKYYYGQKPPSSEGIINIYKNCVPDVICEVIDHELEVTPINGVADKLSIPKETFTSVDYGNGVTTMTVYLSVSGNDTFEVAQAEVRYEPGSNVEIVQIAHRDGSGDIVAFALIAFDKNTNQILDSTYLSINNSQLEIVNLGDGYFGLKDEDGMTVNGHNMGSTYVRNDKTSVDGLGGISFRYEQNMGGGYHKLLGSDGNYYVYDSSTGTYKPM